MQVARFMGRGLGLARRALLGMALAFGAASASAQDLTIGVRSGPLSIDPHFSSAGQHASALRNIFDALVRRSADMELQPNLALSWRSIDTTTWEFALRRDVRWHDGTPFTAADVKFSVERIPTVVAGTGGLAAYVRSIKSAEVVDDHTVRFTTHGPAPTLVAELDRVFIVQARAAQGADNATFRAGTAAVGTGPYRYVSWEPRGDLVLERFDGYWGERPAHGRVTFREIGNDSARVSALLAGDVDVINYVPPSAVSTLARNAQVAVVQAPSIYVFLLHPDGRDQSPLVTDNEGKPFAVSPFRDVRVRRALSLSINRQGMARNIMEGLAEPANTPLPASFFGVPPNARTLRYDPAEARRLLAEAGYPRGFKVQLHCTNDRFAGDARVCAALGQSLAQIGITAEVNALPTSVYFTNYTRGDFSLAMNGWGTLTGDATYMLASLLHTRGVDPRFGTFNRMRYSNPAIDAVTRESLAAMEEGQRRAILERGIGTIMEEHAIIPIVTLSAVWAVNARRVSFTARMDEETLAASVRPAP
ncbi:MULTISPECIES: ABC transporter substrate-binding protein [Roseomonadaceae]|uniref:ABC transporter substrate-binding protein n=1 Tax=Falsiroseomonas oleicola TaxID=2801474 RepID=A0ABS6H7D5_9PROT|nr:ABC transporter substrate-binding protein [Roseomonas oleicola]MBU8544614.1 ABC transporter substrate-binding protein [Roseomonas oleicola]